jgi:hypothetical protein
MDDNIVNLPYSKNDWQVRTTPRIHKKIWKLPAKVQELWEALVRDLRKLGPIQYEWPNYSKLEDNIFHCHLNYRYVAVWKLVDKEIRLLEVTYVGSRENAPY